MSAFLLSVHVLAAILCIGPVAIAASMFPAAVRAARAEPENPRRAAALQVLYRITRVYAVIGIFVPVFGIATGAALGVLTDAWLLVSMALTAGAAALLIAVILPSQRRTLAAIDALASVGASTGSHPSTGATPVGGRSGLNGVGELGAAVDRVTLEPAGLARRLAVSTGVFNLLWAVVVVLMIYRPGSTTGVAA